MKNDGLLEAIERAGGMRELGELLGVTYQAIQYWKRAGAPADRIVAIEKVTGVDRERLRPDLYRRIASR